MLCTGLEDMNDNRNAEINVEDPSINEMKRHRNHHHCSMKMARIRSHLGQRVLVEEREDELVDGVHHHRVPAGREVLAEGSCG